jgi:hypothetical protein
MDRPASIPLPIASCYQDDYTSIFEGTHYIEDSIEKSQPRITCWIDEEGGDEVDLEFMSLGEFPDPPFSMYDRGLTGHTRSSTARATPHPFEKDVCPNVHWSPENVVTNARP